LILAAAAAATVAGLSAAGAPAYTLSANVLTLNGYTFGNIIRWDMADIFQGHYCSGESGNSCTEVRYLDGAPEQPAELSGLIALRWALATTPPPTTVLGFSQGATISSNWIKEYAGKANAPAPQNLSFVLAANPQRKYGGIRSRFGFDTPTPDSQYSVRDIAIEYDGAADFPDDLLNFLAVANALAGFQYVHIFGYQDVDLETADKLEWTEGNTTYVLIRRENLPLLEPLRLLGMTELADTLNGPLKEIIDRAYNRNYPGVVDSSPERAVAQQLSAPQDGEPADETPVAQSTTPARTVGHAHNVSDELDESDTDSSAGDFAGSSGSGGGEESEDDTAQEDPASDDTAVDEGAVDDDTAVEDSTDADEDSSPTAESTGDSGSAPQSDSDSDASDSAE
jgi:hypothetical protein